MRKGLSWMVREEGVNGARRQNKEVEKMRKGLIVIVGITMLLFVYSSANADLVAWWKLDDNAASTTVVDSSGSNNPGTAQQNTENMHTDSGNPPYLNGGFEFDGLSDYINCGDTASLSNFTEKTVLMWVKVPAMSVDRRYFYDDNILDEGGIDYGDAMNVAKNFKKVHISLKNTSKELVSADAVFPSYNEWFMVGYSWDGTTIKYYLNGSHITGEDNAFTGTLACSGNNLVLGKRVYTAGPLHFDGALDNVRIYNHALSGDDIGTLYNGDMIPEPSTLLLLGGGLLGLLIFRRKSKDFDAI